MAWRDRLLPASFRGAAFYVDEGGQDGGRRVVVHEYPLRDTPYIEDMGLAARTFQIDAYVIGDDYFAARDQLLSALEAAGNGSLVHPYLGTKQAKVGSYSLKESSREGRMARFTITFHESADQASFPSAGVNSLGLLNTASDNLLLQLAQSFLSSYNVNLQPQFSIDSLVGILRDGATLYERLLGNNSPNSQVQAEIRSNLDFLYTNAPVLVRDPAGIVQNVQGIITTIASEIAPQDAMEVMFSGYDFTSGQNPPVQTSTRLREIANRDAMFSLFHGTAIAEAARAAVQIPFPSYDDAIEKRDTITTMLDNEMEIADDNLYNTFDRLRKEVVRSIPGEDNDLPRIATFTTAETLPSLTLTHYIYGNIDREQDIVARNRIRHPGFILGNSMLEVLTQ